VKDRLKGVLKQVCQNKGQSGLVELLQCSVQHLQSAELQVFLAQHYLEMGAYVQNNELNAFLIREGIICAHTFSKCLATWVLELLNATEKDTQMVYSLFEFLKEVLLTQKLFAPRVFDELIKALRHKMNSGLFSHSEIILSQLQEMQALDSSPPPSPATNSRASSTSSWSSPRPAPPPRTRSTTSSRSY